MNRFSIYFFIALAFSLSSCSEWSWNKLNPLHLDSELDNQHTPLMQNLPDGRDFSGYPTPGSKKTNKEDSSTKILTGTSTNKEGQVISPYPPHKVLDTMGHPSGTVVKDPETNRLFKLP